jgi:hypothetical protein
MGATLIVLDRDSRFSSLGISCRKSILNCRRISRAAREQGDG